MLDKKQNIAELQIDTKLYMWAGLAIIFIFLVVYGVALFLMGFVHGRGY